MRLIAYTGLSALSETIVNTHVTHLIFILKKLVTPNKRLTLYLSNHDC